MPRRIANAQRSLIAQHPEHAAFVLAAAQRLWQKDIGQAFALAFPGVRVPSTSAIGRFLVQRTTVKERSFSELMDPRDFAAAWVAGRLRQREPLRTGKYHQIPDIP